MFFILSKVLFFIIQPINWLVACILLALLLKNKKWKRRALLSAAFIAIFFTNHFLFNQVIKWWEPDPVLISELPQSYDVGILLGGFSDMYVEPTDRHNFSMTGSRFTETLELYYLGKIKKILITGGSGAVMGKKESEGDRIAQFIQRIGIPKEDFIIENKAKNTHENAIFTKSILQDSFPNASCLLITSAFHMPRAERCFTKEGINCRSFSVDYIGEYNRYAPNSLIIPDRKGFLNWELLIKEWVGIIAYKLRGYI